MWPVGDLPTHAGEYSQWFLDAHRKAADYMSAYTVPGKEHLIDEVQPYLRYQQLGRYDWILLNYLHLKDAGYDVQLFNELPSEGIVVSHRVFLTDDLNPSARTLVICCIGDRIDELGDYNRAGLTIVENRAHVKFNSRGKFTHYFMPHRSQFGMIPRDPERGNQFRNVHYFGEPINLAGQFRGQEFREHLREKMDLDFEVRLRDRWHDYFDTDCILAVRSLDGNAYQSKPPTKMYNAWLAGVPAILGPESAFLSEGKPGRDFLVARNAGEVLQHLQKLKDDLSFRETIISNGKKRALEINDEAITKHWIKFLDDIAKPLYESTCELEPQVSPVAVPDSFNIVTSVPRTNPEIYFFIPPSAWPIEEVPTQSTQYHQWYQEADRKWNQYNLAGSTVPEDILSFARYERLSAYDASLQTYLNLKERGYSCQLVSELPDHGIVIAPQEWLSDDLKISPQTMIVNIITDSLIADCPCADLTIVHNRGGEKLSPSGRYTHYFIPFWTQSSLIPRDPIRGDEFRNIHFFDELENLAPQLRGNDCKEHWRNNLGLDFEIKARGARHDYSQTDCIVAVRDFGTTPILNTPTSNLFNAWLAGVPIVVGPEASYRAERKSPFDSLEVTDINALIGCLQWLKGDPSARRAMTINARRTRSRSNARSDHNQMDRLSRNNSQTNLRRHPTRTQVCKRARRMQFASSD